YDNPLIDVRYGTEVVALAQNTETVTVVTRRGSTEHFVGAAFAIGADGGRSTVREQLGISMSGRSFDDVWLVVDTLNDSRLERYGMHYGDPRRPHVIVPGLDRRCRYEFRLTADEAAFEG